MSSAAVRSHYAGGRSGRYAREDESYPLIRSALASEYADLPAEDVEALLAGNGIRAEDMESFFSDVGNFFSKAAPAVGQVAARALPGIVSGAATGSALGPWGALGGALVGGVTSAIASGGSKPGSPKPASPLSTIAGALPAIAGLAGGGTGLSSVLTSAAPAIAGLASTSLAGKNGTPAPSPRSAAPAPPSPAASPLNPAGVLLGLLRRPELQQALMSIALGSAGARTVPAGPSGTAVPVGGFANLLGALASRAFSQAETFTEPTESLPAYLYQNGELAADPGLPEARAALLLALLAQSESVTSAAPSRRRMYTETDEYYDEVDLAELEAMELEAMDLESDGDYA